MAAPRIWPPESLWASSACQALGRRSAPRSLASPGPSPPPMCLLLLLLLGPAPPPAPRAPLWQRGFGPGLLEEDTGTVLSFPPPAPPLRFQLFLPRRNRTAWGLALHGAFWEIQERRHCDASMAALVLEHQNRFLKGSAQPVTGCSGLSPGVSLGEAPPPTPTCKQGAGLRPLGSVRGAQGEELVEVIGLEETPLLWVLQDSVR